MRYARQSASEEWTTVGTPLDARMADACSWHRERTARQDDGWVTIRPAGQPEAVSPARYAQPVRTQSAPRRLGRSLGVAWS